MNNNMELTNIWAIRDARGLTRDEKLFLMVVESRGVYTRSAANAYEEMDMSRKLFDKVRKSLEERSLLWVKRSPKVGKGTPPNHYKVNIAEVRKLILPADPQTTNDDLEWTTGPDDVPAAQNDVPVAHEDVLTAHDDVPAAHERGSRVTTKRTIEENMEDNLEENDASATATASPMRDEHSASTKKEGVVVLPDSRIDVIEDSSHGFRTPAGGPGGAQGSNTTELKIQRIMHAVKRSHPMYEQMTQTQLREEAVRRLNYLAKKADRDELLRLQEQARLARLETREAREMAGADW